MIIGACGFGATGSSVVTDYLKEFNNVTVKDDLEFTYLTALDGLLYFVQEILSLLSDVFRNWLIERSTAMRSMAFLQRCLSSRQKTSSMPLL